MPSTKAIKNLRQQAAREQGWRCFYCQLPMWDTAPEEFIERYGISPVSRSGFDARPSTLKPDAMVARTSHPTSWLPASSAMQRVTRRSILLRPPSML